MIGKKINTLRKAQGLTLQQLSNASGLSVSFISQVERELASPTVVSLAQLAHALQVSPSYFFPPPPSEGCVVRSYARHPFQLEDAAAIYARLGGDFSGRQLEPLLANYPPHFASEEFSHQGEEFLFVLRGNLMISLDGNEYCLDVGDSMHFHSSHVHRVENRGDSPTQVIFVNTPPYLE